MSQRGAVDWRCFVSHPHRENASLQFASAHAGRCILVTGAGGSIGSALAKTLACAGVERLLLLDTSEISLSELQSQLTRTHRSVSTEVALGSIGDAEFLDELFRRHPVDLIYHAAAWKQVPLLESHPFSAVRNNALGTYILAQAAKRGGVPKLVLISTDKAVHPSSIMGVSKRIAELVVVSLSEAACRMNAIRLCNVIGTSGSVVPLFLEQIARREPVTVTDPQASRWFLTMQETLDAILACGASSQQGKILLPPVGEPVRILDLAQFLIRSSEEGGEVAYIGLRPGDKLTEQLVFESERKVGMEGCLTVRETPRLGAGEMHAFVGELASSVRQRDLPGMLSAIHSVIPEYVPSAQVLEQVASTARQA